MGRETFAGVRPIDGEHGTFGRLLPDAGAEAIEVDAVRQGAPRCSDRPGGRPIGRQ